MTTLKQTAKVIFSTQGRLALASFVVVALSLPVYHWLYATTDSVALSASICLVLSTLLVSTLVSFVFRPQAQRIRALIDSADSLRDADFSFTIVEHHDDEIGELIRAYNLMVSTLRAERQNLHQRELMLDTVLQASPLALVLCNDSDQVIYANSAARELFSNGKRFAGMRFVGAIASGAPDALREAIAAGNDAMVSVDGASDAERYHLSCSVFTLNARQHKLYLLKRLTHELNRQEVATWKKVIRLIGHELNNSLAPISSMAHSGSLLLEREQFDKLPAILATIEQRSAHLKTFIEGYSRFAKLPTPRLERVDWDAFLAPLARLQSVRYAPVGNNAAGMVDRQQLEQVIINLLKNALESGSDHDQVELALEPANNGWQISVSDRGKGMSDEGLASALLPFYSTKKTGSGLGLSLCREIVDAHDGRIGLHNRDDGGLVVQVWLPAGVHRSTQS
ncbi:MAG: ATP-binding protein [Pseudomonadota bacterium]